MNRRQLLTTLGGVIVALGVSVSAQEQAKGTVYIVGFVKKPGSYTITGDVTVREVIAMAGGLQERASDRGIVILRKVDGKDVSVPADLDDKVQPNDTINVRQRIIQR